MMSSGTLVMALPSEPIIAASETTSIGAFTQIDARRFRKRPRETPRKRGGAPRDKGVAQVGR